MKKKKKRRTNQQSTCTFHRRTLHTNRRKAQTHVISYLVEMWNVVACRLNWVCAMCVVCAERVEHTHKAELMHKSIRYRLLNVPPLRRCRRRRRQQQSNDQMKNPIELNGYVIGDATKYNKKRRGSVSLFASAKRPIHVDTYLSLVQRNLFVFFLLSHFVWGSSTDCANDTIRTKWL